MKAIRVFARGLKGENFDEFVQPATVWTGPIGAGKTKRLLAIKSALSGWDKQDPAMGPIPRATVGIEFDEGDINLIERTLDPHAIEIVPKRQGVKGVRGMQERIDEHLAPTISLGAADSLGWDLRRLIAMTDTQQIKFFESLSSADASVPTDDIIARATDNDQRQVVGDLLERVPAGEDPLKWLQTALADEFTATNAKVREADGTRTRFTEIRTEAPVPPGSLDAKRKQITEIAQRIIATRERIAAETERANTVKRREQELTRERGRRQKLQVELDDLKKTAAQEVPRMLDPVEDEEIAATRASIAEVEQVRLAAVAEEHRLDKEVALATFRVQSLKEQLAKLQNGTCPLCDNAVAEALAEAREKRTVLLEDATAEVEAHTLAYDAAHAAIVASKKEIARLDRSEIARRAGLDLCNKTTSALLAKTTAAQAKVPGVEQQIAELDASLRALEAEDPGAPLADPEALQTEIESLNAEQTAVKADLMALEERQIRQKDYLGNEEVLHQARARLAAIKALQKALGPKGLLGESAAGGLNHLVGPANDLIHIVDPALSFDVGVVGGKPRIGCMRETTWIPYQHLSDGEQAIIAMGLIAAFVEKRPYRMLMVNGLECLGESIGPVVAGITGMVESGRLDNFFGAANADLPEMDGVEVVRLEKAELEVAF